MLSAKGRGLWKLSLLLGAEAVHNYRFQILALTTAPNHLHGRGAAFGNMDRPLTPTVKFSAPVVKQV